MTAITNNLTYVIIYMCKLIRYTAKIECSFEMGKYLNSFGSNIYYADDDISFIMNNKSVNQYLGKNEHNDWYHMFF